MTVQYSNQLAEEGLIADALAYAEAAVSLATKAKADRHQPAHGSNIDLLGSFAQDLHERLKAHSAAVGASAARSGQSVVSRVGSFLDRSVMRMLGTDNMSPSPAEISKSASAASLTSAAVVPRRQQGAGHARHPSFDSDNQGTTASAPIQSKGTSAVHSTLGHAAQQPASAPQPTSLMNSMHWSFAQLRQQAGAVPAMSHAFPGQHGHPGVSIRGSPAMQPMENLKTCPNHVQAALLPASLPVQASTAEPKLAQPSKSWFGGIASKLLPGTPSHMLVSAV